MSTIGTPLSSSADRPANMAIRVDELMALEARARLGGPEEARAKHAERGKLLPRERTQRLLDPGAPLLELSPLAAHGMYGGEVPSGGVLCVIGRVHGRLVCVMANDATVKGGTYHPVSVKKHLRAQEIARKNRLPCVYMVDSGGAFLPLQSEMFADREHGGRMFFNQARMSAAGVPQLAVVMGSCTAGGAYVPAMSDEVVIVREQGTIFLAGPPLVLAATGERVTAEDLGGGDVHARVSGVADHLADSDEHALELARSAIENLPAGPGPLWTPAPPRKPAYDPEELLSLLESPAPPATEVLARLLDASDLAPLQLESGANAVAGFARIAGHPVAVLAAFGVLSSDLALAFARLLDLADERRLPVVTFAAACDPGDATPAYATAAARLLKRVATLRVPLIAVIAGPSAGCAHLALSARALGARFVFAWPTAGVSADPSAAPIDPLDHTARVFDDGLIDPRRTREVLSLALEATRHGG